MNHFLLLRPRTSLVLENMTIVNMCVDDFGPTIQIRPLLLTSSMGFLDFDRSSPGVAVRNAVLITQPEEIGWLVFVAWILNNASPFIKLLGQFNDAQSTTPLFSFAPEFRTAAGDASANSVTGLAAQLVEGFNSFDAVARVQRFILAYRVGRVTRTRVTMDIDTQAMSWTNVTLVANTDPYAQTLNGSAYLNGGLSSTARPCDVTVADSVENGRTILPPPLSVIDNDVVLSVALGAITTTAATVPIAQLLISLALPPVLLLRQSMTLLPRPSFGLSPEGIPTVVQTEAPDGVYVINYPTLLTGPLSSDASALQPGALAACSAWINPNQTDAGKRLEGAEVLAGSAFADLLGSTMTYMGDPTCTQLNLRNETGVSAC